MDFPYGYALRDSEDVKLSLSFSSLCIYVHACMRISIDCLTDMMLNASIRLHKRNFNYICVVSSIYEAYASGHQSRRLTYFMDDVRCCDCHALLLNRIEFS